MIDIDRYMTQLTQMLRQHFGSRLSYVGLQGSYLRGEATDSSDIDAMVVIDRLDINDLDAYRAILAALPHTDKACGFICSNADLANWNPLEIGHLLHSTKDLFGSLQTLIPAYTRQDICNFIKLSINNLYHGLCHTYIHADAAAMAATLPALYKGVFFILQNLYDLTHGVFITSKNELLQKLDGLDRTVLTRSTDLSKGIDYDLRDSVTLLFNWCQQTLAAVSSDNI